MQEDTERFEWLCRFVVDHLTSEDALYRLTLILGDAPCACREIDCPHARSIPVSVETFRGQIDVARRSGMGWTMRSIREGIATPSHQSETALKTPVEGEEE